jgi:hypothetical protein
MDRLNRISDSDYLARAWLSRSWRPLQRPAIPAWTAREPESIACPMSPIRAGRPLGHLPEASRHGRGHLAAPGRPSCLRRRSKRRKTRRQMGGGTRPLWTGSSVCNRSKRWTAGAGGHKQTWQKCMRWKPELVRPPKRLLSDAPETFGIRPLVRAKVVKAECGG